MESRKAASLRPIQQGVEPTVGLGETAISFVI